MKVIPLKGKHGIGKFALVDDEDYYGLIRWKWQVNYYGYVFRHDYDPITQKVRCVYLARFLMNAPKGSLVHHIDHDPLDNRRENLQICDKVQNAQSSVVREGRKYKGVSFHKSAQAWEAYIQVDKKKIYLGVFTNEIEAAKEYDRAATEYFGEFALLNFPGEPLNVITIEEGEVKDGKENNK